jgi:hypothetical protein
MCEMKRSDRALSETLAVVFMAMLVVVAALLLIASMTGVIANLLQKPALLSAQVIQFNDNGARIIGVFHQQGDAVNLNGTAQTNGVSIVSITIIDTSGEYPVNPGTITHDAWRPGELLYIYKNGGGSYVYTDVPPVGATSLPLGTYTIKIIDNKVNVLLHALPVTIQY